MLDEPAAGLDETESRELARLIRRLADERNMGVLLVEHDVSLVMSTCDRIVVIDFGRVIASGTPGRSVRTRRCATPTSDSGDADEEVATVTAQPTILRCGHERHRDGDALIEARGLSAGYGKMAVVRELDLHVDAGEVVALIGANGAGKTTTLLDPRRRAHARWRARSDCLGKPPRSPMHARCRKRPGLSSPRSAR